ncbi:MAG: ATP-binding protein, partial [Brevinematales bacterium]
MAKKAIEETEKQLLLENKELRTRLAETEETLNAICKGEADAIVVKGSNGEKVFSLKSAETPYRVIIEEMNEGAVILSTEGIILYCNRRFAELVSVSSEKIIGSQFNQYITESEKLKFDVLLRAGLKERSNGEISFLIHDRIALYLRLSFNPLPPDLLGDVCIMTVDITEIKKNEEELHIARDTLDQQVIERKAELTKTIEELAASRLAAMNMMKDTVKAKNILEITNKKLFKEITGRKRIEKELIRYRDHLEEMVKVRTAELVKSEENLRLAKNQAEAANKSKTVFLSSMSHEIRTPLNAILGFSQLMLREAALTTRQIEWLNIINRSGEHLLALINDILEISRIESGRFSLSPDLFDLRAFLGDMEKMFHEKIEEKNLELKIEIDEKVPGFIELDGNKLRQIFFNLIGNALKFTDEGMIIVRIRAEKKVKNQYRLIAEVEDTGPGITPGDLNNIFNKFEQTAISLRKGGTGLGLAISRQFALMMNGDITVKSEVGKGSCFHLELDFRERKAPEFEMKAENRIIKGLEKGQKTFH